MSEVCRDRESPLLSLLTAATRIMIISLLLIIPSMTAWADESLPIPDKAIMLGCRLINVVQNVGSSSNPKDEFWTIVEFEGRSNIGDKLDFSNARPFILNPDYNWIDATGVADIKTEHGVQRIINNVRIFRESSTNEYFIGLPEFNQIWITVNRIGLGIKHDDRNAYESSIFFETLGCYIIP